MQRMNPYRHRYQRATTKTRVRGLPRALFQSYRRILVFARPYWRLLAIAAVLLSLDSLAGLALPLILRNLVDTAFGRSDSSALNAILGWLAVLFGAQAVFGFGQNYIVGWVGERIVANLRRSLYAHIQSMPLRFFANTHVGELVSRLASDVWLIQQAVTGTLLSILSQSLTLIGGIVIILVMAWRLTVVVLVVVPVAVVGMMVLGRIIRRISRQVQDALADLSSTTDETLSGIRIVKSFARETYEIERYGAGIERLFDLSIQRVKISSFLRPLISALAFGSIGAVLWYGSREVMAGRMSPGQLVSFLLYTMMIANPIGAFASLYTQLQQAIGASGRVFEILDTPPEMQDAPDAIDLPPVQGVVRFDGVSFDYGESSVAHEVLVDVSLEAAPGEIVALVGPSGAGKTTLVNLIPRFYDPTAGTITIDGHDVRSVRNRSLREQIGIVPQETALFSGTIRNNIQYGKLDASQEEIEAAARAANAHDFITELPDGYDTVVGERGVKLSGGQRQRVAIARALLKNPRILILDEATSSLDTESELAVQEALVRLMEERTTFVIAHRLSTITNADQIVVLQNGRVVEHGTHSQLLAIENGLYRRMYALQFRWEEESPPAPAAAEDAGTSGQAEVDDALADGAPGIDLPFLPRFGR